MSPARSILITLLRGDEQLSVLHCWIDGNYTSVSSSADREIFSPRNDPLRETLAGEATAYDVALSFPASQAALVMADPVKAIESGCVGIAGDEAFFIRYTREILDFLSTHYFGNVPDAIS